MGISLAHSNIKTSITELSDIAEEFDTKKLSSYNIDDIVIYDNNIYKCLSSVSADVEFNNEHWMKTNIISIISSNIGNIGAILDEINGEVV